ncbi:MAG: GSCFA domain-containing protein [Methylotenera sp.]|uniref:GSCFA domain-containing protein n=1 Tax=Methylotenera sp. TaxID=2051956 RepID=UPI0024873121|nr:GSCFA domain-containing protein [Methylotenera sp.]MDI1307899.1 GSCFA domain-containing protein [Methylotenera sp.]
MAVSRDAVIWGFRFFLGRDPESESAIVSHINFKDETALAIALISSGEFSARKRFSHLIEINDRTSLLVSAAKLSKIVTSSCKVLVLGNCQSKVLATLFKVMTGGVSSSFLELNEKRITGFLSGEADIVELISDHDLVFVHGTSDMIAMVDIAKQKIPDVADRIRVIPAISYNAYHPDLVYIYAEKQGRVSGSLGEYQSSLAIYGWVNGLSAAETEGLFTEDVYEFLGFFDYSESAKEFLLGTQGVTNIPLNDLISKWERQGCWMHSINHPKLLVLADLARLLLNREGIETIQNVEQFIDDDFANGPCWPVYPEIATRLGVNYGSYLFKRPKPSDEQPVFMLDLKGFIHESFVAFAKYDKKDITCDRLNTARYLALADFLKGRKPLKNMEEKPVMITKLQGYLDTAIKGVASLLPTSNLAVAEKKETNNPYKGLPDYQFWRRAIERPAMSDVDPVVRVSRPLQQHEKLATAGSCFAQHIARTLQKNGFNYYVAEKGDSSLSAEELYNRNYGVFSARYGNLYTTRQLVQLFDRAYGTFKPSEQYWKNSEGKFIDPFRPQIQPNGFNTIVELEKSRDEHFVCVREMFESMDVFVFTLGLTESWRNKADGAVYPLAPGVVAGELNHNIHEFVNFRVSDVVNDMQLFIEKLLKVNPKVRLILTVSPVPLIATYENKHVLVSTTYSKSVLRSAAEELCQANSMCEYFPSYEIITGNYTKGEYFEEDLRSVKSEGVDQVMRLFLKHYSSARPVNKMDEDMMRENATLSSVICDEEAIDR